MKLMKLAKIFVSGVNGPSSGDLVLVCVQWPHSNDPGDNGAVWAAQNIFSINTPRFHNIGNSFNTQKYLKRTTFCCCLSYTILTISERICATAWWGWLVVAEGGIYFTYIQWGFEGREGGREGRVRTGICSEIELILTWRKWRKITFKLQHCFWCCFPRLLHLMFTVNWSQIIKLKHWLLPTFRHNLSRLWQMFGDWSLGSSTMFINIITIINIRDYN